MTHKLKMNDNVLCCYTKSHYSMHICRRVGSKHDGYTYFLSLPLCRVWQLLLSKAYPSLSVFRMYTSNVYLDFFQIMFTLGQISFSLELRSSASNLMESSLKPTNVSHLFTAKNDVILNVSNHVVLFLYKSNMQTQ